MFRHSSPDGSPQKRIRTLSQHITSAMVQKLSGNNYEDFVRQRRATAVHFDADWDVGYRPITRRRMSDAADALGERATFGEVDWDREVELVKSLRIINVPTVVYYLDGQLASVLIGARQNILGRLERLLKGQQIGRVDGLGYDNAIPHFWSQV
jgi:thioredoxin-like negative regulator of GroEL